MKQPIHITESKVVEARLRLLRMHYESKVGHIGGNLSSLDVLMLLHHEFLDDKDRLVVSKGHSAGALYVALWSIGLLTDEDLTTFHGEGTRLPGHPPSKGVNGIPFATGSLGHGVSLAAGLALAAKLKTSDSRVYCVSSDGEWQEGSTWEALIFASHHRLSNLIIFIDMNGLQGFGSTQEVASMDDLRSRLQGFGVVLDLVNGHDLVEIRNVISKPCETCRIVLLKTIKGKGVSFLENRLESHYLPLTDEQYLQAVKEVSGK